MFAIVISEKGGAERREFFDKVEVNVGRVQGNDLMLPKGNVSKRHARLLFRDGRFIVTDLKSTNGTYVNGRKIAQATLVRENDKIYVGDFVLRVEATGQAPPAPRPPAPPTATASSPAIAPGDPATHWDGDFTVKRDAIAPATDLGERPAALPPLPPPRPPLITEPQKLAAIPAVAVTPRSATPSGPGFSPRTLALAAVMERVTEAVDVSPLARGAEPDETLAQRIERTVRERAKALRDEGRLPEGAEVDDVIRDALRELFGLGTLEPLLEEEDVHEIRAFGHDRVVVWRNGEPSHADPGFSSEQAIFRVIARLCRQGGQVLGAGETMVDRQLPGGVSLSAILPPASAYGPVLVLRRRRRAETGLDDLVRSGTLSRPMATLLNHCVGTRTNLLVVGPWEVTAPLVSALTLAAAPDEHLVVLSPIDELFGIEPSPVYLRLSDAPADAARMVRSAFRLRPERIVVNPFAGAIAAEVLAVVAEGAQGVIATAHAPSLHHAVERLVPDLVASRPGLLPDAAASWIAGSFDIAVEISRLRDNKPRVTRIAEMYRADHGSIGTRDLFTFVVERTTAGGTIEGSFATTGIVPRMVEELGAQGNAIDLGLFKRS
jgi:pilus assembly protein CpaF